MKTKSPKTQKKFSGTFQNEKQDVSDLKVGDLVTLKTYCKDSGRLAILTDIALRYNACKIQYIDEEGLRERPTAGLKTNLIKITEDHEYKDG